MSRQEIKCKDTTGYDMSDPWARCFMHKLMFSCPAEFVSQSFPDVVFQD
jgi:hypothetical protein